jgi:hypothetical protein
MGMEASSFLVSALFRVVLALARLAGLAFFPDFFFALPRTPFLFGAIQISL